MALTALQIGRDFSLMHSRAYILRLAGLRHVQSCAFIGWEHDFEAGQFSLVLVCHSVPERDRERIVATVHAIQPSTPVVLIDRHPRQHRGSVDAVLSSAPAKLVRDLPLLLGSLRSVRHSEVANEQSSPQAA